MGQTQYGHVLLLFPIHIYIIVKGHWEMWSGWVSRRKGKQFGNQPISLTWMTEIASQMILAFTFALLWFYPQYNSQQYVRNFHKIFVKYVRYFTKFFKTPQLGSILFVVKAKSLQRPIMHKMFWPQYITSSSPSIFSHSICSSHISLLNVFKASKKERCSLVLGSLFASSSAWRTLLANICMSKFTISFNFFQMSLSQWDFCPPITHR